MNNPKPRPIRSPMSGKQRSTGISISLKALVLTMCGCIGLIVYKIASGMSQEHPNNNNAAASPLGNHLQGSATAAAAAAAAGKDTAESAALEKAQEEVMRQFQEDIKDGDIDKAMANEAEREARREEERIKQAKEEEEKEWKLQGGGQNRWDNSKNIPDWLKEYFEWHNQQRALITEENWRDFRYIILTCLHDLPCGNVAHRLRPIPGHLRAAKDSNRILLIHWDAPQRLEHYMEPLHHGGIDWIVPDYMMRAVRKVGHQTQMDVIQEQASHVDRVIVNSMFNDDSFAEFTWNDKRKEGEVTADKAFHDVWNILFKPTFMMQERISESLRLIGLHEGEYAAAHIDYEMEPQDDVEERELKEKVQNAMNCLSQLRPGGPYFVAAQTYDIARMAQAYGKAKNVEVHAKQIMHDAGTVPKDLYISFVEIYFMANARCVAYNRGGYGQLGYMLGFDYDCRVRYSNPREKKCEWKDGSSSATAAKK